jgi:hypothetical protein
MVVLLIRPPLCLFQASQLQCRSLLVAPTHVQCSLMGRLGAGAKEPVDSWEMVALLPHRPPQWQLQASPLQSRSQLVVPTRVQCSQTGRPCAGVQEAMDSWEMVVLLPHRQPQCLFQASQLQSRSLLGVLTHVQCSQLGRPYAGAEDLADS